MSNHSATVDKPVEVSDEDFDAVVGSHKLVVVDFWAEWCPPCKMMGPIVEALAKEHAGKVVYYKMDSDKNTKIPDRYSIQSIPTFLIFKEGKLIDRIVGSMSKTNFKTKIEKHVNR